MSNNTSLPPFLSPAEAFEKFADRHGVAEIGPLLVSRAVVRVPLLTSFNGRGPNAIITGSGMDPELNEIVGDQNKKLHAPSVATVVVDRETGLTMVHLTPDDGSYITGRKGVKLPINTFGRPISEISDFGVPMKDRDGSEQYSALVTSTNDEGQALHGQLPDDHLVKIADGMTLGVHDAQRLTQPVLAFGKSYGISRPIGSEGLHPSVQSAVNQTIQARQKIST